MWQKAGLLISNFVLNSEYFKPEDYRVILNNMGIVCGLPIVTPFSISRQFILSIVGPATVDRVFDIGQNGLATGYAFGSENARVHYHGALISTVFVPAVAGTLHAVSNWLTQGVNGNLRFNLYKRRGITTVVDNVVGINNVDQFNEVFFNYVRCQASVFVGGDTAEVYTELTFSGVKIEY